MLIVPASATAGSIRHHCSASGRGLLLAAWRHRVRWALQNSDVPL